MNAHDCPDCLGSCYCTAAGPGDPPEDCRHFCPLSGYSDEELEAMELLMPGTLNPMPLEHP